MIKKWIKQVAPHQKQYYKDMLLRRVNEKKLTTQFEKLGIGKGSIVYIQSSLSSLGYYPDGPNRLIRLLSDMVGSKGTIVMPTYPSGGAMEDYVATNTLFDARSTRSNIGLLPEVFRQFHGIRRSCHPTHPVAALGYHADEIVDNHQFCLSPQGDGSPFDKLVKANALLLRIGTPAYQLGHRVQEIVGWPNLFWPEPVTIECISDKGENVLVSTMVYRKKIPNVFFLPGKDSNAPVANIFHDLPIVSSLRYDMLGSDPEKERAFSLLKGYKNDLAKDGYFNETVYNGCILDISQAEHTMKYAVDVAKDMINRFRGFYGFETMTKQLKEGSLRI